MGPARLRRYSRPALNESLKTSDIVRAAVVLGHAYLEDFLRTMAAAILPNKGDDCLNQIPFTTDRLMSSWSLVGPREILAGQKWWRKRQQRTSAPRPKLRMTRAVPCSLVTNHVQPHSMAKRESRRTLPDAAETSEQRAIFDAQKELDHYFANS